MRGSLRVSGRLAGTPQCVGECRVSPESQGDQARGHQRRAGARTVAGRGGAGRGTEASGVPVTLRVCAEAWGGGAGHAPCLRLDSARTAVPL